MTLKSPVRCLAFLMMLMFLTGCERSAQTPWFDSDHYPTQLSAWKLMQVRNGEFELSDRSVPYELATPLFSDYALKLRTVTLPAGESAVYRDYEPFTFPVGTIITKTFYYPVAGDALLKSDSVPVISADHPMPLTDYRLIETRLLVHQENGWQALPYVWNEDQTEATLQIAGDIQRLQLEGTDFAYIVPNRNECASCHVLDQNKGYLSPIGPAARNLNIMTNIRGAGPASQLDQWVQAGLLDSLPGDINPGTRADAIDVDQLARAYLDINCGHCHQPGGSGDTSGLFLHAAETSAMRLGVCKPPVAAGRGAGGHRFSIVPGEPERSILSYRIESTEIGVLMPELGRSLVHEEGLALINQWIQQQAGNCNGRD